MSEKPKEHDNQNVCMNQHVFNVAVHEAIKHNNKEEWHKNRKMIYIYVALWAIFFVWGVMLAMKVPEGPERVKHVVLAAVFAPAYVLAHYIGMGGNEGGSNMGFGLY